MGQVREFYRQWMEWFRQLRPAARWTVVGAGVAVLVALLALAAWGGRGPRMEPLFTRLDAADAAAIVQQLEEKGVPYQLAEGGEAILVPAEQVDRLRLELAAAGLPREGTVGLELINDTPMGATEFERRVQYVRGLQGELARTIGRLHGVETARVHVVMPEESPFVGENRPATAAVLLQLKPGAELTPDQVRSVMHLVASAVEGLKPEDVTVVDTDGRLLSAEVNNQGPASPSAADRFEVEKQFEADLQHSLQTLLEQVLGPGNVVARVNAELNFDAQTIERRLFEPPADGGEGILRSIQELQENFTGQGAPVGVPGDTNIPTYPQVGAGTGDYQRTERTANYEVNEIIDRVQVAPGAVRRLSVAVVVNGPLTAERQQALQQAVAAAIGSDPQRQDQVQVVAMPFDTTVADRLEQALAMERQAQEEARRQMITVAAAAAALLALVAVWVWWQRRRADEEPTPVVEEEAGADVPARPIEQAGAENGRPQEAYVYDQVAELVRNQPQHVAQVIRTWLTERHGS